jgi:hypothetical protein
MVKLLLCSLFSRCVQNVSSKLFNQLVNNQEITNPTDDDLTIIELPSLHKLIFCVLTKWYDLICLVQSGTYDRGTIKCHQMPSHNTGNPARDPARDPAAPARATVGDVVLL